MLGVGIIGCGMISRFHAKAVADIKGAKVVACFDSFTSSAAKFGAEIGCQAGPLIVQQPTCKQADAGSHRRSRRRHQLTFVRLKI